MKTKAKKSAPAPVEPPELTVAEQIGLAADALDGLRYVDDLANNLGGVYQALLALEETAAMGLIAKYGSDDDRSRVVEHLKRKHYDVFTH